MRTKVDKFSKLPQLKTLNLLPKGDFARLYSERFGGVLSQKGERLDLNLTLKVERAIASCRHCKKLQSHA